MAYDHKNEQFSVCAPRSTLLYNSLKDGKKDPNFFTVGSCYVYTKEFTPFAEMDALTELQRPEDLNDSDQLGVLHHINSMRELGFSIANKNG